MFGDTSSEDDVSDWRDQVSSPLLNLYASLVRRPQFWWTYYRYIEKMSTLS